MQAAEKVIKEIEEKITDDNQDELTSSGQYERARKVLQSMQDEWENSIIFTILILNISIEKWKE